MLAPFLVLSIAMEKFVLVLCGRAGVCVGDGTGLPARLRRFYREETRARGGGRTNTPALASKQDTSASTRPQFNTTSPKGYLTIISRQETQPVKTTAGYWSISTPKVCLVESGV